MFREAKLAKEPEVKDGFRLRGAEVSRIEAFSDAVFALAVTLLIVSLETPKTPDELLKSLYQAPVFAVCFGMIYALWNCHYTYCRRYGLQDATVRIYTGVLLFTVLMFVYPLKYVFNLFILGFMHVNPGLLPDNGRLSEFGIELIFTTYGIGYIRSIDRQLQLIH